MLLLLGALAEQCHGLPPGEFLDEPECEFLATVLDRPVVGVEVADEE